MSGAPGLPKAVAGDALVFLDYTQATLDAAYDQLHYAPNGLDVVAAYNERSTEVRKKLPYTTHSYGASVDETLDFFPAAQKSSPLCVFIHGGEWRMGNKEMYSFLAPTLVDAGISVAVLDFSTISSVGMPRMAEQVAGAVEWIFQNSRSLGADPRRIFLAGHSSGAHLAAVTATRDWKGRRLPQGVIKGTVCLGGMFDLYPVLLSYRRGYIALTAKERDALSPSLHLDSLSGPLIVAYGSEETPEFQRQSVAFAAALRDRARRMHKVQGANHFEVLLELADASTPLAKSAIELMLNQR
ncbi:alpha/beta hydrolase [Arthrobacter sp. MI7-26]|uniref:alpha/beta hydrolase n=1 Tax=Arthrobacter sp. MI7-26 TaxID=2993653 RepID=UPI002248926A|nr:alpha/beta hydrolase [Arthrobacter sp. MI7-26]MCX2750442.1 alpha/beta hydrolase [Arthrobacter sp. MI7-26]